MMKNKLKCIDALTLKLLAMTFMLMDHTWATLWSPPIFEYLGRLAFPIFAFQIAEGFFQTGDRRAYRKRLLVFALISELPFNYMGYSTAIFPFHNNVMWTFLIAMYLMDAMERARPKGPLPFLAVSVACAGLGWLLGKLTFVDYGSYGIWMVLLFYWTRSLPYGWLVQLVGMLYINNAMAGLVYPVTLFGQTFEIGKQLLAVAALPLIWLYNGKQGRHSKPIQFACYWFYPVHMAVLYLIAQYIV